MGKVIQGERGGGEGVAGTDYPAASDPCDNNDCCDCDRGCDRGEQPQGGRIQFAFAFANGLGPIGAHGSTVCNSVFKRSLAAGDGVVGRAAARKRVDGTAAAAVVATAAKDTTEKRCAVIPAPEMLR